MLTDLPEAELICRLQLEDKDAFYELYKRYCPKLYIRTLRMLRCEDTTNELLQITFITLWEKRMHLDGNRNVQAYVFQIIQNLIYEHFRKAAREKVLTSALLRDTAPATNYVDDWLEQKENKALINKALDRLPIKRREIYRLCKIEGYSYQQAANLLGLSTSTINDHIVKASKLVKSFLINARYFILSFLFLY